MQQQISLIEVCLLASVWIVANERTLAQVSPEPIIDVHFHAMRAGEIGKPPLFICAPFDEWPVWDPKTGPDALEMLAERHPPCRKPLRSPESDEELMRRTLGFVKERNVTAIASGFPEVVDKWKQNSPERILAAADFDPESGKPSVEELRRMAKERSIVAFAEISNQYSGIAVNDPRMEPYYQLAEELDIPMGIHMGPGPPGVSYWGAPAYRMRLASMLLLEDVLVKHPKLRVWVMHAGWPLGEDAIATMYMHPQVYVDVAVIDYVNPHADFYAYLKRLIDAGFERRIMFGSDEMVWPDALPAAINTIQNAPMLNERQKRNILYNNAARFFRMKHQ
jgi:predicted TIM-barrel fold metal-dependent hydrolase